MSDHTFWTADYDEKNDTNKKLGYSHIIDKTPFAAEWVPSGQQSNFGGHWKLNK